MAGHKPLEDYYRTLGLTPGASFAEVKRAYRALVKVWHPDRFLQTPHLQCQALEKMQAINHAYARLQSQQVYQGLYPAAMPVGSRPLPLTWLVALVAFVLLRLFASQVLPITQLRLSPHEAALPPAPMPLAVAPLLAPEQTVVEPGIPYAEPPQAPGQASAPNMYVTVGSTKESVLAIQGAPTLASDHLWEYAGSHIYFRDDKVVGWEIWPRSPLKVKLLPSSSLNMVPAYFTVGSHKDEVLAVQGTPTRLSDRVWEYGHSRIYFNEGRVTRWEEWRGMPLKARPAAAAEG